MSRLNEKKKIAIFGVKYFPSKGGTSRVVENLLWEMKDEYDFTIYCYKHPKAATYMEGVRTIQFAETPIRGIGVFIYYIKCLWHILRNGHYDLVHIHKKDSAFCLPSLTARFKTITTSHGITYLNGKWSWIGNSYFKMMERLFVRSNTIKTTISKPHRDFFKKKYETDVHFIPNGIQALKPIQERLAAAILQENDVQGDYIFFAARRVLPIKGCHTLIKALQRINYKGTLVVAGDLEQLPHYSKELKGLVKDLNVKFIGYVAGMDKLNALLSKAQFFAFPSEIEGMSMMLLEASLVKTPIICSDIPENKAVMTEDSVLFFESKNVADLADKLNWAFANESKMKQKAAHAQQETTALYLNSRVAQQYLTLYETTISTKELMLID